MPFHILSSFFLFYFILYFSHLTDTVIKTGNVRCIQLFHPSNVTLFLCLQVEEIRAHAAEWTANVSAEFKETRRRVSVEIYDKFQRAASIKRKLSSELGFNPGPEFTLPRRTTSVNFNDERDRNEREAALQGLTTPLARNNGLFMNGLDPEKGDVSAIEQLQ